MELPENYVNEQCLDWDAPTIIVGHPYHGIVEQSEDISFPEELGENLPVVHIHKQSIDLGCFNFIF